VAQAQRKARLGRFVYGPGCCPRLSCGDWSSSASLNVRVDRTEEAARSAGCDSRSTGLAMHMSAAAATSAAGGAPLVSMGGTTRRVATGQALRRAHIHGTADIRWSETSLPGSNAVLSPPLLRRGACSLLPLQCCSPCGCYARCNI